jgi:hypothetical protein
MKLCFNLQIVGNSNEELRQQLLAIMDIIDNEAEDAEVTGINNEYKFIKQKLFNKNVLMYEYQLELGVYSRLHDVVFPRESEFFSLPSYEVMLKELPHFLSQTHPLYLRINYLLTKICKLQS